MRIEKGTSAAIAVTHHWANLMGVRKFLRQKDDPDSEIRGRDDSHIIFAKVADAEDPVGLWIEIDLRKQDGNLVKRMFLIPWREILTIVIGESVWKKRLERSASKAHFQTPVRTIKNNQAESFHAQRACFSQTATSRGQWATASRATPQSPYGGISFRSGLHQLVRSDAHGLRSHRLRSLFSG